MLSLNHDQVAKLNRAVVVDTNCWKAVCINCYDLVSLGLDKSIAAISYVMKQAYELAQLHQIPMVFWLTESPLELELALTMKMQDTELLLPAELLSVRQYA
jgi:hypothetical protein